MLKSLAIASLVVSLAACAAAPTTPGSAPTPSTAAQVKPPPGCVAQTATRIPVKDDTCAGFGSTHTKQDVDNTGQTDLSRALPMLDPSVTRTH